SESYGWWAAFFLVLGLAFINGTRQRLVLDPRGFRATGLPWGRGLVRWRDIDRFFVTTIRGAKVVGFLYSPAYVARADERAGLLAKLNLGQIGQARSVFQSARLAGISQIAQRSVVPSASATRTASALRSPMKRRPRERRSSVTRTAACSVAPTTTRRARQVVAASAAARIQGS